MAWIPRTDATVYSRHVWKAAKQLDLARWVPSEILIQVCDMEGKKSTCQYDEGVPIEKENVCLLLQISPVTMDKSSPWGQDCCILSVCEHHIGIAACMHCLRRNLTRCHSRTLLPQFCSTLHIHQHTAQADFPPRLHRLWSCSEFLFPLNPEQASHSLPEISANPSAPGCLPKAQDRRSQVNERKSKHTGENGSMKVVIAKGQN